MKRETISIPGRAPSSILSPAVRAGDFVWASGHVGRDPSSGQVPDGIEAQSRLALESIKEVLQQAGASLQSVVKVNVYLTDIAMRNPFNAIYLEYFPEDRPARTAIGNVGFEGNVLVEVECVAVVGG